VPRFSASACTGEQPPQCLVIAESTIGEQTQGARQAFQDRTIAYEDRRHPDDSTTPDAEQLAFAHQLAHLRDVDMQALGDVGKVQPVGDQVFDVGHRTSLPRPGASRRAAVARGSQRR
jgi:hypothetical protein